MVLFVDFCFALCFGQVILNLITFGRNDSGNLKTLLNKILVANSSCFISLMMNEQLFLKTN